MSIFETLRQDVRYAVRGLRGARGFTVVVALTLALGIGTNTVIFSVVDQVLLRPLPYRDGEQVVRIHELDAARGTRSDVNPGNWLDWQRQSRTLESLAAWDPAAFTLTGAGEPERLQTLFVSAEFFPLLGVPPLLGRAISAEDDRPNASRVTVLSHALWQRRFNSDPRVIGQIIRLNEVPFEIIGVMPPGFRFVFQDTDFWTPFRLDRTRAWRDTAGRFMSVVARIKAGVSIEQARAEMDGIARGLQSHPRNKGMTVELVPIRQELVGDVRLSILVLYGAVLVLLGIACLNVANLMLARSMSRRREIAIRSSIGAGRAAIVRQLLVESVLLASLGGIVGVLFAQWGLSALIAITPEEIVPLAGLHIDSRILLYVLGLSALTAIIVGLAPAAMAIRTSVSATLRSTDPTTTHSHLIRRWLLVGQVAMTVVLLCGAGLLVRTVATLSEADPGFNRSNLLTMEVALPAARYDAPRAVEFFRQVRGRFQLLPGVESAAAAASLPVTGALPGRTSFQIRGEPDAPETERHSAAIRIVTPDYFRTLGVPVLRGREFTDADQVPDAPLVFVVNETFASRFLQGRDPLDVAMSVGMQAENPYARIVGVVGDVSEGSLWDSGQPTVFYNHRQLPSNAMVLFLRAPDAAGLTRAATTAVRELDPNLAVVNARTIESFLSESLGRERLLALVSSTFAVSGLLLASLGLYGLLAYIVAAQTKEIGVRIALGARLGELLRGVFGGGLRLVALGAGVGIIGAVVVSRSLGFLLFGISPYDPWTYASVLIMLAVVSAVAMLIPARRATRIDPVIALRAE